MWRWCYACTLHKWATTRKIFRLLPLLLASISSRDAIFKTFARHKIKSTWDILSAKKGWGIKQDYKETSLLASNPPPPTPKAASLLILSYTTPGPPPGLTLLPTASFLPSSTSKYWTWNELVLWYGILMKPGGTLQNIIRRLQTIFKNLTYTFCSLKAML